MQEEHLLTLIFSNQLLFCGIFGAFGGVIHSLDVRSGITLYGIIRQMIISCGAGILLFFATYDFSKFTPAWRIASAIVVGFFGSTIFRLLAESYINKMGMRNMHKIPDTLEEKSCKGGKL